MQFDSPWNKKPVTNHAMGYLRTSLFPSTLLSSLENSFILQDPYTIGKKSKCEVSKSREFLPLEDFQILRS